MGKNQAYKNQQRAKMSSHSATAPGEEETSNDGFVDGSFHSPEWHKARLASLQTSHTVTWEEWKKKQREEERVKNELADDEEKRMREYRAQLDAERSRKLARGRNHAQLREDSKDKSKKSKKDEDKKGKGRKRKKQTEKREKKRKANSDSDSDSSDSEESSERRSRSRKGKRSSNKSSRGGKSHSSSESGSDKEGPVRLSNFFDHKNE